jgi:hypothetical protein
MTVSAAESTSIRSSLAGDLLLARLLPSTKARPKPAQVRADVARFFRDPLTDEAWQTLIDNQVEDGLLTTKPLALTEIGRTTALAFLGIKELPHGCFWKVIRARFLFPKALVRRPG